MAVLPSLPSTPSNPEGGGIYRRQNGPSPLLRTWNQPILDLDLGPARASAMACFRQLGARGSAFQAATRWG